MFIDFATHFNRLPLKCVGILLKYQKPATDSAQFLLSATGIFYRNRENTPKIYMKPQNTLKSQRNPEKE